MSDTLWDRRRIQLEQEVRKAALNLLGHTGSNQFELLLDPPRTALRIVAGPAPETPCGPAECWRRLTQTVPVDQPEGYSNLQDVKLYPVRAEALDGLIRRAESCDRVTAYPATQGDLISALREVRDRRASDKAIAAVQGPWWTPTLEVERLMRWCNEAKTDTVEISAKVLEGLLHDSLLWRKDRAAQQGSSGDEPSQAARDITKEVALMALCAVQREHSASMHPNLAKDVQTAIDGLRGTAGRGETEVTEAAKATRLIADQLGEAINSLFLALRTPNAHHSKAMRNAADELKTVALRLDAIERDRDQWKRLAMDRNAAIGALGQENERLKQESRENPWGLRRIPSAWMRIVRIASTPDQPPGEYDIECYAGDEPPDDGNKDWVPLYRRTQDAVNTGSVAPSEPPPGLLMSMALRMDHGLGVPGYYDQQMFGSEAPTHKQRLEAALITARQMWEEVTGHGFYRPEKEAEYVQRQKAAMRS